ncbi:MAG: hypothetical protein A3H98_02120 [Bacteroidetes bacterium RIFCSPLOWO2_02_FULL_36_8]|nr:MAG: hypothetical protein A3H98_02120 [Bacteroidetes bacterium RIFCSPLOWO2_02_FULL_36_8]OFY69212.1 MAG: hypothetical protein A3G23_06595 [Bacteroidetes bacterium RIFCSPLOWO2_12_FULL_37_12]
MNEEIIFEKVKTAISNSCGIEKETILPESTLFNDLAITSIDIVDILYTLETEFNITLKISDLETESRNELKGVPFEIDNVITKEGLEVLKKRLPEISDEKLKPGITIYEIINLVTVRILCRMILFKIHASSP